MRDPWLLIAQTSGSKIYWVTAMLLTSVITARFLGPSGRGVLVAAVGWVTLFSTLGYLSLGQVIIYIAATRQKEEWLAPFLGSLLAILGAMAVLGWFVAAVMYVLTRGKVFQHLEPSVLVLAFAALPFLLWIENGNGALMALGKLPIMNLAQVVGATATLLLTLVALGPLGLRVPGALGALLIAQGVTVAISLGYLFRKARSLPVRWQPVRELLGGGMKLHLNAIGTYLFTQANVLILNYYRSSVETAYYQLGVQLLAGLQIIPLAVSAVSYSLVSQHGPDQAWPAQRRLLFQVTLLVGAIGVAAYLLAPLAIRIVFGAPFLPAVPVFRILLLGILGMSTSIVMASQWIGRGLFLQAALLTLCIGAATVAGNYLVVPRYGMVGAAWVTVATYAAALLANSLMAVWVQNRWNRLQPNGA